ncbi:hypothetical protein EXIGLDRAFT_760425 [Exidia glandulosa HHB12029]|uniref:Coatomer subunit delta n=1 Tax=Exidia glandulosa HHB12029 TaxID=1314781 RepID=A0A165P901_EXIGL|nr:hypothetical protein EXIGLDRAFT_760425 [Exidia glandulosa HHB12029]
MPARKKDLQIPLSRSAPLEHMEALPDWDMPAAVAAMARPTITLNNPGPLLVHFRPAHRPMDKPPRFPSYSPPTTPTPTRLPSPAAPAALTSPRSALRAPRRPSWEAARDPAQGAATWWRNFKALRRTSGTRTPAAAAPTRPSRAPRLLAPPAFKGTGMKLGAKKVKGAELLDAMEADPLVAAEPEPEDDPAVAPVQQQQVSATPSAPPPGVIPTGRGSLPSVAKQPVHIAIHKTLSLLLTREGAPRALELRGDLNLPIVAADVAKIKLSLKPSASATRLQFKQHPNVAKFAPGGDRVLALKAKSRAFPVGQPLGVLTWRCAEKDEGVVPLSINCWPTPNTDGTWSRSSSTCRRLTLVVDINVKPLVCSNEPVTPAPFASVVSRLATRTHGESCTI